MERHQFAQALLTVRDSENRTISPTRTTTELGFNNLPGRKGIPTDILSYQELLGRKDNVFRVASFVRDGMHPDNLSYGELEVELNGIINLPVYLTHRSQNQLASGAIDPAFIDASRMALGIRLVIWRMQQSGISASALALPIDILNFAQGNNPLNRNYFRNTSGSLSCPAHKNLVLEALDLLTAPIKRGGSPSLLHEIDSEERPKIFSFGHLFAQWIELLDMQNEAEREPNEIYEARGEEIHNIETLLLQSLGYTKWPRG